MASGIRQTTRGHPGGLTSLLTPVVIFLCNHYITRAVGLSIIYPISEDGNIWNEQEDYGIKP